MEPAELSDSDFQNLVWDYLDGNLSAEDFARLCNTLSENPARQHNFLELAALDHHANETIQETSLAPDFLYSMGLLPELDDQQLPCSVWETDESQATLFSRWTTTIYESRPLTVAIAASLTAIVFFLSGMLRWPGESVDFASHGTSSSVPGHSEDSAGHQAASSTDTNSAEELLDTAATITGMLDAKWTSEEHSGAYGEPLQEGRLLSLAGGFVQITFECGAKILLQGPADFQIRDDMRAILDTGKIAALCPQRAHGFSLRTPSAEVIDLGTEFALQVNELGASEVHVFDGEVITQALDSNGELIGDLIHVTEQMAVRYEPDSTGVSTIRFNGRKFRRELEPLLTEDELPRLPVKRDLALWLAADQMVKLDEQDGVIAWRDIQTGDNQTAEDAFQHIPEIRPIWIDNAINGRPALHFNGSSHLVTTPLETTDNQTISLVFSLNQEAISRKDEGGQLLNYNGPPSRKNLSVSDPGVLQIGDFSGGSARRYGEMFGFVYSSGGGRPIHSGQVRTKPIPADVPVLVTYVYNRDGRKAKMFVNGVLVESNTASVPCGITSRKVIGCHVKQYAHFMGDLAELLIFNEALSERDRRQLDRYLLNRYLIPKGSPTLSQDDAAPMN